MALLQMFKRNMPPYSGYLLNFDNIAHFHIVSTSQKRKQDVPKQARFLCKMSGNNRVPCGPNTLKHLQCQK
jgi:hypothetical protein